MKRQIYTLILLFVITIPVLKAEEKRILTSDGVELFVTVKGKGIPCLYIHGGPGSGAYWLEAFSGNMLEQHMQMIYLDQRGVSRSSSPKNKDYSMDRMLKDFEEVRSALNIDKWIVLGHSFGGGIQTAYAAKYPNAVSGMIMLNTTINISESLKGTIEYTKNHTKGQDFSFVNDTTLKPMQKMGRCMNLLGENVYKLFYREKSSSDTMDSVMNRIENWNGDFSSSVNDYPEYFQNFAPLTVSIKVPVLVFSGNTDYAIGPEHYKLMKFKKMMLYKADVGHLPFIEAKQDLETAINAYLKKYFKVKLT
ncbi:alpha/beta fold hydrolase [Rubrolithibacter danxiaensis]|uniref:alpha/beta fold hydrolase n=1 Tax=Rubrolithibacter danxiaensis TaxID=3390805 RepID=UPI003BF7DD1A